VEFRPRLGVRRPYRRQYRDSGFNGARKNRAKSASFCLRFAEPVQDQKLDIMVERLVKQHSNFALFTCIEAGVQAQAIRMQTKDYERAYEAFVAKTKPVFKGN